MGKIIKLLKWLEIDRAVAYAILSKIWLLFSGPITLVFISLYLTPEVQGYYYTFLSLIALQAFVELGFFVVITQFASHEWVKLDFDNEGRIIGDPIALSRLISLGRLVFKWYAVASCVFIIIVGLIGYFLLSGKSDPDIIWETPWFIFIVLSGLQLWVLPFLSLLEGCNQVANIYKFRFIQSIISPIAMWLIMYVGGELWIAVASVGSGLLANLIFLAIRYRKFFESFIFITPETLISWRSEVWPMQWRLGVSGISHYLMFSLFTPILFHYHGAIVAGQIGMTLQLIGTLSVLANAWVTTKAPRFGMLIAQKSYTELDRLFYRSSIASMIVILVGAITIGILAYWLSEINHPFSLRLLPPLPFVLFLAASVLLQTTQCMGVYLRAHKKEPFMILNVVTGLCIGLLIWVFGSQYGPIGAALSYLLIVGFVLTPFGTFIWYRCRSEWHKN